MRDAGPSVGGTSVAASDGGFGGVGSSPVALAGMLLLVAQAADSRLSAGGRNHHAMRATRSMRRLYTGTGWDGVGTGLGGARFVAEQSALHDPGILGNNLHPMEDAIRFEFVLRQLRERAGLTQLALATAIGVRVWTVASWETGRRRPRDEETLNRIADACQADVRGREALIVAATGDIAVKGLLSRMREKRRPIRTTADLLATYGWPCLLINERYQLLAWNYVAEALSETDLGKMLPTSAERNLLWMAVLPHFRDVRLTNFDVLIGELMGFLKDDQAGTGGVGRAWFDALFTLIATNYPEMLERLYRLWETAAIPMQDGSRNLHPVEWCMSDGSALSFHHVAREWSVFDGTLTMDWHPANSATWTWLESNPTKATAGVALGPDEFLPLPERLREQRRAVGMTRAQTATAANLAPDTIAAYEQGARRPSRKNLIAVARAISLDGATMNELLQEIGQPPEPTDFARWCTGESHLSPMTIGPGKPINRPTPLAAILRAADDLPWPTFVANDSCEVVHGNAAALRLLNWRDWQPLPGRDAPHLLQIILSEWFRERCTNWEAVARALVPVELEPLVLAHDPALTKSSLRALARQLRAESPEIFAALTEVDLSTEPEAPPRVAVLVEWRTPEGTQLRFHCLVAHWNAFDAVWAIDLHPADAATWRWFGR